MLNLKTVEDLKEYNGITPHRGIWITRNGSLVRILDGWKPPDRIYGYMIEENGKPVSATYVHEYIIEHPNGKLLAHIYNDGLDLMKKKFQDRRFGMENKQTALEGKLSFRTSIKRSELVSIITEFMWSTMKENPYRVQVEIYEQEKYDSDEMSAYVNFPSGIEVKIPHKVFINLMQCHFWRLGFKGDTLNINVRGKRSSIDPVSFKIFGFTNIPNLYPNEPEPTSPQE